MEISEPTQGHRENSESRYIKLEPDFTKGLTWSHDPVDLDLDGVFRTDAPKLLTDFNIKGLQPILKERYGDRFILEDFNDAFYIWIPWEGHLWKVDDVWTKDEELHGLQDIVENIFCHINFVHKGAKKVFKAYD